MDLFFYATDPKNQDFCVGLHIVNIKQDYYVLL